MELGAISTSLKVLLKNLNPTEDPITHPLPANVLTTCLDWRNNVVDSVENHWIDLAAKSIVHEYSGHDETCRNTAILLDVLLLLYENDKYEITLLHNLIEEVLETETISWCERFWSYMIIREGRLCQNLVGNKSPGLSLIRYCNSLMRRLSKNQHAQFSGTVAMFLARAFPLDEKSGLNIRGVFDTDNVTLYEKDDDEEIPDADDKKAKGGQLYEKFWSLQDVFMHPVQLFSMPNMDDFRVTLSTVLAALKQRDQAHMRRNKKEITGRNSPGPESDVFVPKWLTRKDLIELQLNDVAFRRTVLAQVLILCEFLTSLSSTEKALWPEIKAVNRSVMYGFTLSEQDTKFFSKIAYQLRNGGNSGDLEKNFDHTVAEVITSDTAWQHWKLQSCPSFVKPGMDEGEGEKAAEKLSQHKKPRKKFWHAMGSAALTKAWKIETGVDLLKNDKSQAPPTDDFYQESLKMVERQQAIQTELNEPELEPEENKREELDHVDEQLACATWRGLRAARGQGHWVKFSQVTKVTGFAGLFMTPEEVVKAEEDEKLRKKKEEEDKLAAAAKEEEDKQNAKNNPKPIEEDKKELESVENYKPAEEEEPDSTGGNDDGSAEKDSAPQSQPHTVNSDSIVDKDGDESMELAEKEGKQMDMEKDSKQEGIEPGKDETSNTTPVKRRLSEAHIPDDGTPPKRSKLTQDSQ